jgi:hypothetical protein
MDGKFRLGGAGGSKKDDSEERDVVATAAGKVCQLGKAAAFPRRTTTWHPPMTTTTEYDDRRRRRRRRRRRPQQTPSTVSPFNTATRGFPASAQALSQRENTTSGVGAGRRNDRSYPCCSRAGTYASARAAAAGEAGTKPHTVRYSSMVRVRTRVSPRTREAVTSPTRAERGGEPDPPSSRWAWRRWRHPTAGSKNRPARTRNRSRQLGPEALPRLRRAAPPPQAPRRYPRKSRQRRKWWW